MFLSLPLYFTSMSLSSSFSKYQKELIHLLQEEKVSGIDEQIIQEMLVTIARLRDNQVELIDLKIIGTALKELRYAFSVFQKYRGIPKVAVFGSARVPRTDPNYQLAEDFGRQIVQKGWMVITGGANGIMEAAIHGAGTDKSFGLNILLPFEQSANPFIRGNKKLINFKYFFTRKLMFLKESEATVLFPGGFGTLDEGLESLTLVQTGKAKPRPILLIDHPQSTYWNSLLQFFKTHLAESGMIGDGDMHLITHFHESDRAADYLAQFYSNYHSSRFLGTQYLIRLRHPISDDQLEHLTHNFKDILEEGRFERFTEIEKDDEPNPKLIRIIFSFDKLHYDRLHQLMDALNHL